MTIHERPRLISELVVEPYASDGLLFAGSENLELLRGRSARTLLERVLPLLDGTRRVQDIAALLPSVPVEHIQSVVGLLFSRGLLEDGQPARSESPHTAAFSRDASWTVHA